MWEYGVKAIVDLRSEQEIAKRPSPFEPADYGPLYLHRALIDDEFADAIAAIPAMPDRYRMILEHRQEALAEIVSTIARVDGPVVFHCFAGKDRTGLVAAILLSLAGVTPDVIAADYAATDVQMESRYREWLAAAPADEVARMRDDLRCPPEWMVGVLDHIDEMWGGAQPYLTAGGAHPEDIVRVKAKLTG